MQKEKRTFLLPFIMLSSFVAPSLVVIAYVKPTAGFDALVIVGWFALMKGVILFLIGLASLSALVYLIRAEGKIGRLVVVLVLAALWAGMWYAVR